MAQCQAGDPGGGSTSESMVTSVTEWLEDDDRPTLILDLDDHLNLAEARLHFLYVNKAFEENAQLSTTCNIVLLDSQASRINKGQVECSGPFKQWAIDSTPPSSIYDGQTSSITADGHVWRKRNIGKRWRIVYGSKIPSGQSTGGEASVDASPTAGSGQSTTATSQNVSPTQPRTTNMVWTDTLPWTGHASLSRKTDWSKTALGPIESWSSDLRQMVRYLFADSRPGCLFWGPHRVIIYNESYISLASTKHPELFASTCAIAWSEVGSELDDVMRKAEESQLAATMENQLFLIERQGSLEECYFSGSFIPIFDLRGETEGFYNSVLETSKAVISDRRTSSLLSLTTSPSLSSFWNEVGKSVESNSRDIPLAVVYSVEHQPEGNLICRYQTSVGIDQDHPALIPHGDLHTSAEGLIPHFRKAVAARGPLLLTDEGDGLAEQLFKGNHWRGFAVPPSRYMVLPLSAGEGILGFMFWGLNPRRPHDEDSKQFVELLSRQLQSSLTSTVFLDQARLNQKKLESDLALAESKFKTMAELNPGGIFYISPRGELLYGNDTYYELTGHKRNYMAEMSFMEFIHEDDHMLMQKEWHLLTVEHSQRNIELILKKQRLYNGEWRHTTILASVAPELGKDGQLTSIMGTTIDVSEIKQAQEKAVELSRLQRQSRIEAEKAKAAQERHIDITSHEMRNPLSAILQSADSISTTITEYQESLEQSISDLLDSTLESASIITLCAQQQNRILNDILTLSKLDSGLLPVAPSLAQPEIVARDTLKMFEGELQSYGIEWNFVVEETYKHYEIDWVMMDASRLSQVLINVMTNAIKFTRNVGHSITASVGATDKKPPEIAGQKIAWFPSKNLDAKRDLTEDAEWGKGEQVFLSFAIRDTGRGLSEEETQKLFHRFSQVSPRTHVEFGGSGLGLFISRELTELQGGEIGVASASGKGSTFAFYVKGRRASAPKPAAATPQRFKASSVSNAASHPPANEQQSKASRPTLHALLVEDNLINQKVLRKQLMKYNFDVQVANHGAEAIEYLKTSKLWIGNYMGRVLDVVLMDLEMPVMDGLTCARKIRELQREGAIAYVPLIAVTANARKEQINDTLDAGMDDVMTKPFKISELLPKIERLKDGHSQGEEWTPAFQPSSRDDEHNTR